MKIVSFNINGLRAHFHQLKNIIKNMNPDIIGLQETKINDEIFPKEILKNYGYYSYYYGQKQYYGVALISKIKALKIYYGLNKNNKKEAQKRIIVADFITNKGILTIINCYAPQGNNYNNFIKFSEKKYFYYKLLRYIEKKYNPGKSLLTIIGDMNICHSNLDIGFNKIEYEYWLKIGKCSFLPEEQEWLDNILNWGLIDIYRKKNPKEHSCYSWFSYKKNNFIKRQGLRIDYILLTNILMQYVNNTGINYNIRKVKKTSDHIPIWVNLNLNI